MTLDKVTNSGQGVYSPIEGVSMFESDWRPAFLSLVQNTSAVGTAGRIRRTDTDEEYEVLKVVPLAVQAQRTYWGAGEFVRGRTPECKSNNAITADLSFGDGSPTLFAGRSCASCEFRSDNPFERGDMCQAGYMVAFYSLDTSEAFLMRLNGSATRIARVVGNANTVRQKTISLYAQEVTTANGRFWGLRAGGGEQLTADQKSQVEAIFRDSPLSSQGGFSDEGTSKVIPTTPSAPSSMTYRPEVDGPEVAKRGSEVDVNESLFTPTPASERFTPREQTVSPEPEPSQAPLVVEDDDDEKLPW